MDPFVSSGAEDPDVLGVRVPPLSATLDANFGSMVDSGRSIAPPLDAEGIISAQLLEHAVAARGTVIPDQCRACGRLTGHSIFEHQARVILDRLVHAGLTAVDEPTG
ncbi:MAG: hypothetical protein LH650_09900 [Chloroflexi bacterium]|nr:hypothetical protein [Chloroflexota bacterium]